ncbi:MAG: hypothetical protein R6W72_11640 [Desulfurivibrionaceae bacterium]
MGKENKKIPEIDPEKIESKAAAEKAVEELREAVRFHDYRYYVLDDPVIPDSEYDSLFEKLKALEEKFDLVSPIRRPSRWAASPGKRWARSGTPCPCRA